MNTVGIIMNIVSIIMIVILDSVLSIGYWLSNTKNDVRYRSLDCLLYFPINSLFQLLLDLSTNFGLDWLVNLFSETMVIGHVQLWLVVQIVQHLLLVLQYKVHLVLFPLFYLFLLILLHNVQHFLKTVLYKYL